MTIPDFTVLTDAELQARLEDYKKRIFRRLKSESASGFSATKEDFANEKEIFNALAAEAKRRGLISVSATAGTAPVRAFSVSAGY